MPQQRQAASSIAVRETKHEHRPYGIHPVITILAMIATFWFLGAISVSFAWDGEADYISVIAAMFSLGAIALVLLTGSFAVQDFRWQQERSHFSRYLRRRTAIATGPIRGQQAVVQILALPFSLAFGVTALGLIWVIVS